MKNAAVAELEGLLGEWTMTMTDAWFLESRDIEVKGQATIQWLGDALLYLHATWGEDGTWDWVIGRSDANERLTMLYHDERGVCRVFDVTYRDGELTALREDPDFHQRLVGTVSADRIDAHWDASEDFGATWRKDFDLIFERKPS